MSNGVSASIYMGVILDEAEGGETPAFLEDFNGDFDDWAVEKMAPELRMVYVNYDKLSSKQKNDLWSKRCAIKKECPVEMIAYNHYEYAHYAIVIRGFEIGASYGAKKFIVNDLYVSDAKMSKAMVWCKQHGLAFDNPSLLVAGYYG